VGTADCMLGERGQTRGRRRQPPPLVRTRSCCTVVSCCLFEEHRTFRNSKLLTANLSKGCSRHSGALLANVLRSNVSRVAPLVHQQTTRAFSHQVSLCLLSKFSSFFVLFVASGALINTLPTSLSLPQQRAQRQPQRTEGSPHLCALCVHLRLCCGN
jgi:hypothetical protein